MKLDNRSNTYKVWFRKFLSTVVLMLLLILVGYTDYFKTPVLGVDKTWYLVVIGIFYIGLSMVNFLVKPNFVFFSDNGDKIVLRYYPMRIFNQKKNSIEIPKNSLVSWEIKKFLFGTCEMLFLSGRFKTGIAKYPGVSLSAVNRKDREKIKSALEVYVKMNLN